MAIIKHTRVTGSALGLTINGTDYWADISKYELAASDSDKDVLTFGDAASGNTATWTLKGEAVISFDTGSFWDMVWANAGKTVPFILAPHGNKTATTAQPHFKGQAKIATKPPVSSEAGEDKGATFEFEWTLTAEPERVTTTSTMGTGSMEDALKAV